MSFFKKLALAAAPIVVGAVAGPEAGAVAVGVLGAGAGTKIVGKRYEARGGRSLHKSGTPLVAAGASLALGQLMSPDALAQLCAVLQQVVELVCNHQRIAGPLAIAGAVVASHGGVSDLFKSLTRKKEN